MDEYLTAVRDVGEAHRRRRKKTAAFRRSRSPSGIPFEFSEYVKLMFDLQAIAFQADLTRVTHHDARAAKAACAPIRRSAFPTRTIR